MLARSAFMGSMLTAVYMYCSCSYDETVTTNRSILLITWFYASIGFCQLLCLVQPPNFDLRDLRLFNSRNSFVDGSLMA